MFGVDAQVIDGVMTWSPGPDPKRAQQNVQPGRRGGERDRVSRAGVRGERALELGALRAGRDPARFEHRGDRLDVLRGDRRARERQATALPPRHSSLYVTRPRSTPDCADSCAARLLAGPAPGRALVRRRRRGLSVATRGRARPFSALPSCYEMRIENASWTPSRHERSLGRALPPYRAVDLRPRCLIAVLRHGQPYRCFDPSRFAHFRSRFAAALLVACAGCQQVPLAPIDAAANRDRIAARSLTATAVDDALARHSLPVTQRAWSLDQLTLAAWTLRTDVARRARRGRRRAREDRRRVRSARTRPSR